MGLSGVDPNNPLAAERREFIPAAGVASAGASSRPILLFGPKTSAGSETVDTLGDPIADEQDIVLRAGARSLLRWMYKKAAAQASGAQINFIAASEGGATTAATRTYTFAGGAATADTTLFIEWAGESAGAAIITGDTPIAQAAEAAALVGQAGDSSWPFTAAVGGSGSEHVLTVTSTATGPDGLLLVNRLRIRHARSVGTTITAGAAGGGGGTHDFSNAYAAAGQSAYYHASSQTATGVVSATDNGVGEHIKTIKDLIAPSVGHECVGIFGLVGTQSQATAVATSSAANSAFVHFFHEENNPWHPGMLAAYHAGMLWKEQITHPAANLNEYVSTDSQQYDIPAPYDKGDWLTEAEQIADANNGVCPIGRRANGDAALKRFVTARSLNQLGGTDYRARPGKIPSVFAFFWQTLNTRWVSQVQQFVADDPPLGTFPKPGVSYPKDLKGVTQKLITDLCSGTPLGIYTGPILDPSKEAEMLSKVECIKSGAGRLALSVSLFAIEDYLGSDSKIFEIGTGY